jgi:5-(carboxyamino)imidazole ribonucleotide synthase
MVRRCYGDSSSGSGRQPERRRVREREGVARVPVRPGREALYIAQNRLREKTFLAHHGFPVVPFLEVGGLEELREAALAIGLPAVLKTAGFGYDGKGQVKISSPEEIEGAFVSLQGQPAVLEAFIPFEREVSVVGARGLDGSFAHYGVVENIHRRHILDITLAPAEVPEKIRNGSRHQIATNRLYGHFPLQ